jgi:LacI family transcriptional regulator
MAKPNIHDVAKIAGVSIATVSHTINDTRFVSEDTKQKVLQAIETLGYSPDIHARSFRTGKKKMIGFIIPDISNKFFATLIERVEEVISEKDYHLIIANTRETKSRELDHLSYLTSGVVDGLLLASTLDNFGECEMLIPSHLPIVQVDRVIEECPFDSVTVSAYDSVFQSVVNLVKNGKRRIGYITGLSRLSTTIERLHAYKSALVASGIELDPQLIQDGDSMENSAYICTKKLLAVGCSAIVVSNGLMAVDVVNYLTRCSMQVGKDISLVCFSDYDTSILKNMNIDLVEQPVNELGRLAGEQILRKIETPHSPQKNIILSSTYTPSLNI